VQPKISFSAYPADQRMIEDSPKASFSNYSIWR
jgi:hypothetical protein